MIVTNYNSVTHVRKKIPRARVTGSSFFHHDGENFSVKRSRKIPFEIEGGVYSKYLQIMKYRELLNITIPVEKFDSLSPAFKGFAQNIMNYRVIRNAFDNSPSVKKREYKLNGARVRKRAIALSRLEKSRKHLAFYSISFPAGAPDAALYEIWNRWLTNCRRRYGLNTYLWVSERQKNGTLHYHLLTNDYMDISKVNAAMAASIRTSVNQEKMTWGQSSYRMYHGVDVDSVQRPKRRQNESRFAYRERMRKMRRHTQKDRVQFVVRYLAKYMSKEDEVFNHLPWHCSRDVSRLFTTEIVPSGEFYDREHGMSDVVTDYKIYPNEFYTVYVFKHAPSDNLFRNIDAINEKVYELYHNRGDPQFLN